MDAISSGDESDAETLFTEMLEDNHVGSQSHPSIYMREVRCKIRDCIKRGQLECIGAILSMQNMGNDLHKMFKAVLNILSQALPILGESGSEFF